MDEPLVTIQCTPLGIRVSKITREGEEVVLEPSLETKVLAVRLWALVAANEPEGHSSVWPRLEEISDRLNRTTVLLEQVLHQLMILTATLQRTADAARIQQSPVKKGQ